MKGARRNSFGSRTADRTFFRLEWHLVTKRLAIHRFHGINPDDGRDAVSNVPDGIIAAALAPAARTLIIPRRVTFGIVMNTPYEKMGQSRIVSLKAKRAGRRGRLHALCSIS